MAEDELLTIVNSLPGPVVNKPLVAEKVRVPELLPIVLAAPSVTPPDLFKVRLRTKFDAAGNSKLVVTAVEPI